MGTVELPQKPIMALGTRLGLDRACSSL